jgi:hypothetical protein
VILVFRDISERRRIEAERETQDRISRSSPPSSNPR